MHSASRYYDALAWALTLGREPALRARLADLAHLEQGEAVLDVGCGTGTLAILAKRRVGAGGVVHGIDASRGMVARAARKAVAAGVDVSFHAARAEAIPFPDARFDVVLSSLMLHHLPRPSRALLAAEIRRVLKPGGRVLAVDFEPPAGGRRGLIARVHRHGHVPLREVVALLAGAGLRVTETGSVGLSDLQFAVARRPALDTDAPAATTPPPHRSLAPLPVPRWLVALAGATLVAGHAAAFRVASSALTRSALGVAAAAALVAVAHAGRAGGVRALLRRHRRHGGA